MREDRVINVFYHDRLVGTLAMTNERKAAFEYADEWLENGFSISPFSLPLEKKVCVPVKEYFNGLWGVFADSLPDAWGQLLLDRMLKEKGCNIDNVSMLDRLAIVGESGCGKSTFLKTLNRMNDLVDGVRITGEVKLDDEDIYAEGVDTTVLRKRIGMVFQQPNPFPMSIYDNIAYGPRVHGMKDKSKLDAIVEESLRGAAIFDEVKDRLKKSALGLSGGQQQRICIARALAVQPEVLLMDEPTSALDPISTSKIEELMEDLKKKYTVVVVTHNMQQAARVSDKTAFFYMGSMVEYDDTKKIFTNPSKEATQNYITGRFG